MNTLVGRWAPMVVVPTLVLALAGCSSDDEPGDAGSTESATDTASPSESTSTPPTTSPPDLPTPPTVGQPQGGAVDVDWDPASCETDAGEQTVSGTVTNPTDDPTGYLITMSWTDATSNTLGLGFKVVRGAKPGVETDWTLTADVSEGATQCVINVLRGVIKK